jgi:hypothetical protein
MVSQETLRQLTCDRRSELEREAESERLVHQLRAARTLLSERPLQAALLGRFVAARRHAVS